jgi:hypothetical protein
MGIMQVLGAVDADADQVIIFLEKLAPLIVEQRAIGLHGVLKSHPRFTIFFLVFDGFPKKIETHYRGFTALPGYGDFLRTVRFDQLLDVIFKHFICHSELAIGVKQFLIKEETVRTGQVACRTTGF